MIKVIVVDDERFVRMGIVGETDWTSLGCEVVGEAENGLDALELVHEKNPELMICDIRMPKMNGLEMLKKKQKKKNPVQVIFLTAYSEFSYARGLMYPTPSPKSRFRRLPIGSEYPYSIPAP